MSNGVPRSSYDPRRIFLFNLPKLNLGGKGRDIGTYLAGGLVSLSFSPFALILNLLASLSINLNVTRRIVRSLILPLDRRIDHLFSCTTTTRCAVRYSTRQDLIHRLDPGHL